MDGFLKQSTAITVRIGPFLDSTDGNTQKTNLTIAQADVVLSKAGGAFAQKNDTSSCTHDTKGYYACSLNATDTNTVGMLKLAVHVTGALAVWHTFMVLPANVYDSLVAGTDNLEVKLTSSSRAAIWDEIGSLNISFENLMQRTYQMINNKMTVNESSGAVTLRNLGDTSNIATGSVVSSGGITTRGELNWT